MAARNFVLCGMSGSFVPHFCFVRRPVSKSRPGARFRSTFGGLTGQQ